MSHLPSLSTSTDRNLADLPTAAWVRFSTAYTDATGQPLPDHLVTEATAIYPKPVQS